MANPKKPTALRVLQGNPGKRPLPKDEPKPDQKMPKMPAFLDPIAEKEWRRMGKILFRLGLLTEVDGTAFAGYCVAYSTLARINEAFKESEYRPLAEKHSFLEQKERDGRSNELMAVEAKNNPLIAQQLRVLQTIRFFCQEFGMTPSSRGKMSIPGVKDIDPLEDYLSGKKKG